MLSPETVSWNKEQFEVETSLMAMNSFKVKQQSSFVLSLLSAYTDKKISLKQLKLVLNKVEHFHFVFNAITQQRSSGSIATMYSQHAIDLTNADNLDTVQKVLSSLTRKLDTKMPSYEEFEVKFLELNYLSNKTKSKTIIKYALCRLLGKNSNGLDINHSNLTIEHLLPEAKIKTGGEADVIGSIGNLILTDANTNGHMLKDKSPSEKIEILIKNGYPLDQNYLIGTNWGKEQVLDRAKKISSFVYSQVKV